MNKSKAKGLAGRSLKDPFGDRRPYVDWFRTVLPYGTATELVRGVPKGERGFGKALGLRGWPAGSVVMAIIDDSIAFAHERFRDGTDGTRVAALWLQDADLRDDRVPFGRELSCADIKTLIEAHTETGLVDEDAFYRDPMLGLGDDRGAGLLRHAAHGTLNLDLLAGHGPEERDKAMLRPILAVQLPRAVTRDTSGTFIPFFTRRAVEWIIRRAGELTAVSGASPPLPIVVVFSYGTYAGPHDGSSDLELALEALAASSGGRLHLVMPAGNSYLSRTHARLGEGGTVTWRLQPDDRTPSFVEVWSRPAGKRLARQTVEVTLAPPSGWWIERTQVAALHTSYVLRGHGGGACARVYRADPARGTPVVVAVAPTEEPIGKPTEKPRPDAPLAPSGDWQITVEGAEPVDLWIQRDDTVLGPSGGRQSYFPEWDDAYRYEHDGGDGRPVASAGPVTRTDTLNAMATGAGTIVVAGYRRSDGAMAPYSSSGRVEPGTLPNQRPDLAAPSEEGTAHFGTLGAGSRSGSAVAMRGTSFAAPQVGRDIASRLRTKASNPVGSLQAVAVSEERTLPPLRAVDGDPQGRRGGGRIAGKADSRQRRRGPRREAEIELGAGKP